jgi:hypothetical protein
VVEAGVGAEDVGVAEAAPPPLPPQAARKIINTIKLRLIDTWRVTCFQEKVIERSSSVIQILLVYANACVL